MNKFKFTPEMFWGPVTSSHLDVNSARQAQVALDKHLDSLPKVRGVFNKAGMVFSNTASSIDTHIATIFNAEEIRKSECKHEFICSMSKYVPKDAPAAGSVLCADCGVEMVQKWVAK